MKQISSWKSFGGNLQVFEHESTVTNCTMQFACYLPPQVKAGKVPVLWYLSGLTCNWSNVMEKAGLQALAAEYGIMVIAPDTSPRGEHVADDDGYDLGQGAGFYLSATKAPWSEHYKMDQYITEELQTLVMENFPADPHRQGITGHSMGGHGAISLYLKNLNIYQSCSAFSPILSSSSVPWGKKALSAYLGDDTESWAQFDSTELVKQHQSEVEILIDQGTTDQFREEQLNPTGFLRAAAEYNQPVLYREQDGYDHSYYFVASFMPEHFNWHAQKLKG